MRPQKYKRFDSVGNDFPKFVAYESKIIAYNISHYKKTSIGIGAVLVYLLIYFFVTSVFVVATVKPAMAERDGVPVATSDFLTKETPKFIIDSNGLVQESTAKTNVKELTAQKGKITANIINVDNIPSKEIVANISSNPANQNEFTVDLAKTGSSFRAGKYTLSIDLSNGLKGQHLTQNFTWGVLVMNFDASSYVQNANVGIGMAVLNDVGKTICDAKVDLEIITPLGQKTEFSTTDKTITVLDTCGDGKVTDNADYQANYKTTILGTYKVNLTAETINGIRTMSDKFEVNNSPDFVLKRVTATRIYPVSPYTVRATVEANQDAEGVITEEVPAVFKISEISGNGTITNRDRGTKTISWLVNLSKGSTYNLSYTYKAPEISPEFYTLGPIKITEKSTLSLDGVLGGKAQDNIVFQEPRAWQIATDAVINCALKLAGGAASWSTTGTWTGTGCTAAGAYPGSTNTDTWNVTIASTTLATLTLNVSPAYPIASLAITGNGVAHNLTMGANNLIVSTTNSGTGAITIGNPTATAVNQITISSGTLTAYGPVTITGGATSGRTSQIAISTTGNLYARAGVTFSGTIAATSVLSTAAAGNVYLTGTMSANGTVTMAATSTLHSYYNGASGAATISAARTWGNVVLDASTTLAIGAAQTVAGNWTNSSSTVALSGNFAVLFRTTTGTGIGGGFGTTFYDLTISSGAVRTLNTNTTVSRNFLIAAPAATTTLNHASGVSLAITGTAILTQPTAAVTNTWAIGAGSATVTGLTTLGSTGTTGSYINQITLTTGSLTLAGLTFGTGAVPANKKITITGTGTVNISGAVTSAATATSTPGTTSTWNFNGSAASQAVPMNWGSGGAMYANLTLNNTNASGATLSAAITAAKVVGGITVGTGANSAIFNDAFLITGNAGKVFTVNNLATFNMTGAANNYPTVFTFAYGATSTENFQQTFTPLPLPSATTSFGNLGLVPAGIATQNITAYTYTVRGNLTVGNNANAVTVNLNAAAGTMTVNGNVSIAGATVKSTLQANASTVLSVGGSWTNAGTFTHNNGTVTFTGTAGPYSINSTGATVDHFYNFTINGGAATTWNMSSLIDIDGTMTITSGTLAQNGNNLVDLAGNLSIAAAGRYTKSTGTFQFNATAGTVTWTDNSTGGPQDLGTVQIGNSLIAKVVNLTTNATATSLNITLGATLSANSSNNITVSGNWTNAGTFTASSGTVTLSGASGTTQIITGNTTFNNLTATASAVRTINFQVGSVTTVTGTWTCTGASGYNMILGPNGGSSAWHINPTAWSVNYVAPSYSTNDATLPINPTVYTDGGNNTNWFAATNTAPTAPALLAQKKVTGGATLATGDWTNETQVQFTATTTDPDASDTVYLCVEAKAIGTALTSTNGGTLCGTGVANSSPGSAIAVSVTITGLSDATEYHWQAQAKDALPAYSSWTTYGGNTENPPTNPAARDFGTDTAAPTGLTVYDGNNAGVDAFYNDGLLTTLHANWTVVNFNASGPATPNRYQYAIGTTVGGTDILTWTSVDTNASTTNAGLSLATNVTYYYTVKATDLAGNVTTVSSDGQNVLPTFSVSFVNSGGGNLADLGIWQDPSYGGTATTQVTTTTNANSGYLVYMYKTSTLQKTNDASKTVPDMGATYPSAVAWATPCPAGTACFGYTSNDALVNGSNIFSSGSNYCALSSTAPGDRVADSATPQTGGQAFTITYKVQTNATQAAGTYTTSVQFTVVPQY